MKLVNLDPNPDFGTLIDLASTQYGLSKSRFQNRYPGSGSVYEETKRFFGRRPDHAPGTYVTFIEPLITPA